MSFVDVNQFACVLLSMFFFDGEMWDLIVLVLDHCLSFYFESPKKLQFVFPGFCPQIITGSLMRLLFPSI